jgi:hypothetical protein
MKIRNLITANTLFVALLAVNAGFAQPQSRSTGAEHRFSAVSTEGIVTSKSPAVTLKAVGRLVSPGLYVVDPRSIQNKRLALPPSGKQELGVCVGEWDNAQKGCKGTYYNLSPASSLAAGYATKGECESVEGPRIQQGAVCSIQADGGWHAE